MELLHIGGNAMVDVDDVIAVVSRETAMRSRDTRRAIDAAIGRERIRTVSDAPEKAYILAGQEGAFAVWSSPIAPETLLKRAAGGTAGQLTAGF